MKKTMNLLSVIQSDIDSCPINSEEQKDALACIKVKVEEVQERVEGLYDEPYKILKDVIKNVIGSR